MPGATKRGSQVCRETGDCRSWLQLKVLGGKLNYYFYFYYWLLVDIRILEDNYYININHNILQRKLTTNSHSYTYTQTHTYTGYFETYIHIFGQITKISTVN